MLHIFRTAIPWKTSEWLLLHRVGADYRIMDSILTDNGREFTAQEIEEVASILNVNIVTTAAESPFQNGPVNVIM